MVGMAVSDKVLFFMMTGMFQSYDLADGFRCVRNIFPVEAYDAYMNGATAIELKLGNGDSFTVSRDKFELIFSKKCDDLFMDVDVDVSPLMPLLDKFKAIAPGQCMKVPPQCYSLFDVVLRMDDLSVLLDDGVKRRSFDEDVNDDLRSYDGHVFLSSLSSFLSGPQHFVSSELVEEKMNVLRTSLALPVGLPDEVVAYHQQLEAQAKAKQRKESFNKVLKNTTGVTIEDAPVVPVPSAVSNGPIPGQSRKPKLKVHRPLLTGTLCVIGGFILLDVVLNLGSFLAGLGS